MGRQWRRGGVVGWLCALALYATPLAAQTPAADSARAAREPLFVPTDALYAGGFVLGTLALYPIDLEVAEALRHPSRQANRLFSAGATGFGALGFPGSFLVTGGIYAAGRLANRPALADVGLHTGESLGMAVAITVALKALSGRARPHEDPLDPHRFGLGRGLGEDRYQSFPSGHASSAFAAAAALSSEIGRLHPDKAAWAKAMLYGSAGLVAVSRIYDNEHWASDVVAGAAIGTFSGWKVVRYNHTHRGNRLDRIFLTGDGLIVSWSFPLPS